MSWLEYHDEPVTLHSGGQSHWLVRGDLIFADVRLRETVLDYWEYEIAAHRRPYFFWAIPTGGSCWAEAISERVRAHWNNRPGPANIRNGATIFTVDDVLTTGGSLVGCKRPLVVVDQNQREHQLERVTAWATMYLPVLG